MIEEALQHFESGNFAAAEVLYRKMLEDEPDNPEVLFMLSLVRQGQNDLDEPVDLLNHAIRVQPGNPSLHYSLGTVHLRRQQLNEAEQAFHKAAGIDPNFVGAQNGIAVVELTRGRFAAAEQALRKALKAEPDNPQVLINMGIALREQGRTSDAIGYLQQVVNTEPQNISAQSHLGRAFLAAEQSGFAIQCFENVLAEQPDNIEVLKLLAQAQAESGHHAEAARRYRKVLDLGEETAATVSGLARALKALGRKREAEGAYLRALRLTQGEESLLLDLCAILLQQGRYAEVIYRLKDRLDGATDEDRMVRLLAEAKIGAGDAAGALDMLRPLVSDGAPDHRARLLLARALLAHGEKEAANDQVERLLALDPPPVDAVLFRTRELLQAGELEPAIDYLRGIQRRPDLSHAQRQDTVRLLATALHRNGQYQAAWEQFTGLDAREPELITLRAEKPLQLEVNEPAETAMDRDVAWSWPPQPPQDGRPEPVFVFGWPGSGRADLLRALAAHPAVCSVGGALSDQKDRRLLISHPQGKGPLNRMTSAQIQLARRKYWKSLKKLNAEAGTTLTVDGLWLPVEAFPTVYRLFPQAHMVVLDHAVRELAVAWLQAGYRDLEKVVRRYQQQQELLQRCRASVPLNYIDVDVSQLQQDPGGVLRTVISELALPWDGAVEQAFDIELASDLAPAGGWENYQPWLQEVEDALAD